MFFLWHDVGIFLLLDLSSVSLGQLDWCKRQTTLKHKDAQQHTVTDAAKGRWSPPTHPSNSPLSLLFLVLVRHHDRHDDNRQDLRCRSGPVSKKVSVTKRAWWQCKQSSYHQTPEHDAYNDGWSKIQGLSVDCTDFLLVPGQCHATCWTVCVVPWSHTLALGRESVHRTLRPRIYWLRSPTTSTGKVRHKVLRAYQESNHKTKIYSLSPPCSAQSTPSKRMQSQYVSVYGLYNNINHIRSRARIANCSRFNCTMLNKMATNAPKFEAKARQLTLLDNVLVVVGLGIREPIATQSESNTGIDSTINVARINAELCLQIVGLCAVTKKKIGTRVGVRVTKRAGNRIQQRWRRRRCHGAFHNHRHANCRVDGGSSPNKVRKQSTLELEIEKQFKLAAYGCLKFAVARAVQKIASKRASALRTVISFVWRSCENAFRTYRNARCIEPLANAELSLHFGDFHAVKIHPASEGETTVKNQLGADLYISTTTYNEEENDGWYRLCTKEV